MTNSLENLKIPIGPFFLLFCEKETNRGARWEGKRERERGSFGSPTGTYTRTCLSRWLVFPLLTSPRTCVSSLSLHVACAYAILHRETENTFCKLNPAWVGVTSLHTAPGLCSCSTTFFQVGISLLLEFLRVCFLSLLFRECVLSYFVCLSVCSSEFKSKCTMGVVIECMILSFSSAHCKLQCLWLKSITRDAFGMVVFSSCSLATPPPIKLRDGGGSQPHRTRACLC